MNVIKFTTKHENILNDIPFVVADENRFKQIIYNLVDNAIKYTEEGKVEIGVNIV